MRLLILSAIVAVSICISSHGVWAETTCTFDVRSSVAGNIGLDNYGFRVREGSGALYLEQRFGDGSWRAFAEVVRLQRPGFMVYLQVLGDGDFAGHMSVLTVEHSGRASLLIHHGASGNLSQYRRAWMYQGTCD